MRAVTLAPIRRYTAANLIKFVFNKTVNDRHGAILRRGGAIWIPRARGQVQDLAYPPFWESAEQRRCAVQPGGRASVQGVQSAAHDEEANREWEWRRWRPR